MKYLKLYEEITQYKKISIDLLLTNLYKKVNIWNNKTWEVITYENYDEGCFIRKYHVTNGFNYELVFIHWSGDDDEGEYEFEIIMTLSEDDMLNKEKMINISERFISRYKKTQKQQKFNL